MTTTWNFSFQAFSNLITIFVKTHIHTFTFIIIIVTTTYELDLHTLRTTYTAPPRWQLLIYYKLLDFFYNTHWFCMIFFWKNKKQNCIFLTLSISFVVASIILPPLQPFFSVIIQAQLVYFNLTSRPLICHIEKTAPLDPFHFEIHALLSILDRKKSQHSKQVTIETIRYICAGNGNQNLIYDVFLIKEGLGVCLNERL